MTAKETTSMVRVRGVVGVIESPVELRGRLTYELRLEWPDGRIDTVQCPATFETDAQVREAMKEGAAILMETINEFAPIQDVVDLTGAPPREAWN